MVLEHDPKRLIWAHFTSFWQNIAPQAPFVPNDLILLFSSSFVTNRLILAKKTPIGTFLKHTQFGAHRGFLRGFCIQITLAGPSIAPRLLTLPKIPQEALFNKKPPRGYRKGLGRAPFHSSPRTRARFQKRRATIILKIRITIRPTEGRYYSLILILSDNTDIKDYKERY